MNIAQIEDNIEKIIKSFNKNTFIYELLLSYGLPKASITRIQKCNSNLSKNQGEIVWKRKLLFKEIYKEDLHETIDLLRNDSKLLANDPRFIVVTDYKTLLAVDTKIGETLDIEIEDIAKHYDFFLPWAGMEKAQFQIENPADVKAAERMGKLYDEIKKENPAMTNEEVHSLNVFLSRLLFCFFAEDTGIFEDKLFTKSISSHTQIDGSDLNIYIYKLFEVLDSKTRSNLPAYLEAFPYVNGGLFRDKHKALVFTRRSRQAIIDSGELNWSAINPDIFGSMIQTVITPEQRGNLGMHYTSIPNIMKVVNPLFLDALYEEFDSNKNNEAKLKKLLTRLSRIKIFDPACGSGNFLIIAYKEIRRLEMKIFKQLNNINLQRYLYTSTISLSQFYGIELDDFAHEVAILSLWLAEHQMNVEFKKEFGHTKPTLPLQEAGKIIHGNATRLKWEEVCPKQEGYEIYILGNPPYLGSKRQSKEQKIDMALVFKGIKDYKNLDYIACWFFIGAKYIDNFKAELAFVSTNSITQGDQIALLWPHIFNNELEIGFAHKSFKWSNNAKSKAAVICVIVSIRNIQSKPKYLFSDFKQTVLNISPYLNNGSSIIVYKRTHPLSSIPEMVYGNMPLEGGFLKLSKEEKNKIIKCSRESEKFIRPLIGGEEFIKNISRYCLWIEDNEIEEALKINEIKDRINGVEKFRENGGEVAQTLVSRSHQFRYRKEAKDNFILVPCTTSERRNYMQCGFYKSNYITLNSAQIIYDSDPYIFGVVSSRLHMVWIRAVAGRLKSDYRYSTALCYNTFPMPTLTKIEIENIKYAVFRVLQEREKYSEKTIGQLYDPEKMPKGLLDAHLQLDLAVECCYRSKPFESDEERIEYLFKLYEKMIEEEKRI